MKETRTALLEAANTVILRDGIAHLTLEATAREAGVSKGGLLHHFPSKEALVRGLLEHYLALFEAELSRRMAQDPDPRGRFSRALIGATFDADPHQPMLRASLLAALALNPELLKPVRAAFDGYQQRIEDDGLGAAHATLLRLAADGLWFADLLHLAPPQGALREQLRRRLLALTHRETE
ncbi:TetR/AcrR family transcriptional regulator [uncultured Meiothermus sp.]|uniref:TetR/AcrR family transcriptional regulator n=1 Tax=uncultured Meiothermus sp. TaxID=157471 RepID=UPI00263804BE|nr:TetR/AcrR family transcriptional regulator [uncultured Meiothermus sp.]